MVYNPLSLDLPPSRSATIPSLVPRPPLYSVALKLPSCNQIKWGGGGGGGVGGVGGWGAGNEGYYSTIIESCCISYFAIHFALMCLGYASKQPFMFIMRIVCQIVK